jgi:hypothetical protein
LAAQFDAFVAKIKGVTWFSNRVTPLSIRQYADEGQTLPIAY